MEYTQKKTKHLSLKSVHRKNIIKLKSLYKTNISQSINTICKFYCELVVDRVDFVTILEDAY